MHDKRNIIHFLVPVAATTTVHKTILVGSFEVQFRQGDLELVSCNEISLHLVQRMAKKGIQSPKPVALQSK